MATWVDALITMALELDARRAREQAAAQRQASVLAAVRERAARAARAEQERLLALTPLGRQALARRRQEQGPDVTLAGARSAPASQEQTEHERLLAMTPLGRMALARTRAQDAGQRAPGR